ncbi:chondroitinase family polysaccharide lyase [Tichowtungia aerotolerans]|uniref:Uncharacterized protein n=1 Tax=Tichowtungia aerotolerans TaxID=2697043 RepID=A0A6P1M6B4_9BACT|nr:chondroitinase family polysaccharide lyase [Tichowtungia aerotolerans]QHI70120.1 hypothetical protein GT409_11925 [Tichowtungia aerotolerans]
MNTQKLHHCKRVKKTWADGVHFMHLSFIFFLFSQPGFSPADTLVGSFHLQSLFTETACESAVGLPTRLTSGDINTRGTVSGSASYLVGHALGADGYAGAQIKSLADAAEYNNMVRYGEANKGGVVFYDFDLSGWATGKDIGYSTNQVGLAIRLNYANRRTAASFPLPVYVSYSDGSSLTLDTTVTTTETAGSATAYGLVSNTAHFIKIGEIPAGPPAAGTKTFDITEHLLASTNQVLRIALFVTEYYGDLRLESDSGLVEITGGSVTVPVSCMASWQDWDSANLSNIATINGSCDFIAGPAFDGPYSLRFNYSANSSLTFPCRYPSGDLYYGAYFFSALFDPDTSSNETYLIEFIEGGSVACTITLHPDRPFWNRAEAHQVERYDKFQPKTPHGLLMDDYIPRYPDSIRIKPPQGRSGTVYIGKLFLGNETKKTQLNLQMDEVTAPISASLPSLPSSVTTNQSNDLAQIRIRLEEIFGVASYATVSSISTNTMTDLQARYQAYNIQWNASAGVWAGDNTMMYQGSSDYACNEKFLGDLMLEVATAYRNTTDATQKNELKNMYFDLFDFSECIFGIPDNWAAGMNYLPSAFLMRAELDSTGRLSPLFLGTCRNRIGFNRIYREDSWFAQTGINGWNETQSSRDISRDGEMGENVDYLRIISIQLVINAVLGATENECVRDLEAVCNYFSDIAFQTAPGTLDGFRPDGLAYHHWGWVAQYGIDCLVQVPKIVYALSGTEFRIREAAHQRVKDALISLDWMSLYSIVPSTLSGKSGFPYAYGGRTHNTPDPFAWMALSGTPDGTDSIDEEMAGIFLRSFNDFLPNSADPSMFASNSQTMLSNANYSATTAPEGTRIYSYGDMAVHRKNGWLWSVKGHSKFQFTRESADPWVTYLGYGMLDLVQDYWVRYGIIRLESEFGVNGYDWRKYPGTTTIDFSDIQDIVNHEYKRWWSDETFVGGLVQNGNGIFTMCIKGSATNSLGSYRAKKSWFFFDGTAVAMGSGISNSVSAEPTITTLYQDGITSSTETWFNNTSGTTGLSTDSTAILGSSAWLVDSESTGYWVPAGENLTVKRRAQTNPNWDNNANVSGDFALAWLNHGNAPNNASYWYVQTVGATPAAMSAFNTSMNSGTPPFQILENSDRAHAVWSEAEQTCGITVFDVTSALDIRDVKTVSRPCVLMMQESSSSLRKLSVADPDLDLIDHAVYSNNESWGYSSEHTVTIVLNGLWSVGTPPENLSAVLTNGAQNTTTLTLTVKEGLTTDIDLVAIPKAMADQINSFNAWLGYYGLSNISTSADSDKDTVTDLQEYAFNLNPAKSDRQVLVPDIGTSGLPFIGVDTCAEPILNVTYLRRKDAPNLSYTVEFCNDLVSNNWEPATSIETITLINSVWEQVKISDSVTNPLCRFGRVRIGVYE